MFACTLSNNKAGKRADMYIGREQGWEGVGRDMAWVAGCCNALQCIAVRCSVLQ